VAELVRNRRRVVVEVPAAVRPADVVAEYYGCLPGGFPRALLKQDELVEYRVPVVVAVDESHVNRRQIREHIEGKIGMHPDVIRGDQCSDFETRRRVDDMQNRPVVSTELGEGRRVLSGCGSDFDDDAWLNSREDRTNNAIPKAVHST
jgi:hypothetical protein